MGVPFDEIEELVQLDGSVLVLVDVVDHVHDVLFGGFVAKLLHDGAQFLRGWGGTLGEICPSPLASKSLKACLNSSTCSGLSLDVINKNIVWVLLQSLNAW